MHLDAVAVQVAHVGFAPSHFALSAGGGLTRSGISDWVDGSLAPRRAKMVGIDSLRLQASQAVEVRLALEREPEMQSAGDQRGEEGSSGASWPGWL